MSHEDVVTLFHEMGHCLHHVLTQVDVAGVSGSQGVEWDAVEIPSQLLENWCYREEVLPMLSSHYKTGSPLPHSELVKIIAAKNFQSALRLTKQLEKSLFDIHLHFLNGQVLAEKVQFMNVLRQVQDKVTVIPVPEWHRFANGFDHIFAGGYAAGYYGYIWAEVYSADMFSEFKRAGVFNLTLSRYLLEGWFAVGGVRPALDNFKAFLGRDVDLSALLDDLGIGGDGITS